MDHPFVVIGIVVVFIIGFITWLLSRLRRCPSDRILVVYGRVGKADEGMAARCMHGGAAFVWPVIQDYSYLDLAPMAIEINLQGALSQQNIRVNVPSVFTVGISTDPGIMENAAERLLGLARPHIQDLAKDIIFGQMRVVIATMPIEEINSDRDKLVTKFANGVEVELKKIGLRLINVNIQDITDDSGYIDALGKEAAARAINEAKVAVSQQERDGDVGKAEADREKRIKVAAAHALAVKGENEALVSIANSNASRREREAEAQRLATAAEKVKSADALREAYAAEETAERQRALREEAALVAEVLIAADIDKRKIELAAEAEAERIRRVKRGEADGIRLILEAQAEGAKAILSRKAEGLRDLVAAAQGSPSAAAQLMITEQLPVLVAEQVKAISSLKIDKITVWDSGAGANGKNSTANFLSGMAGVLPPLHELTRNVGIDLPSFLGTVHAPPPEDGAEQATTKLESSASSVIASAYHRRFAAAQAWAKENANTLFTFDRNKDGVIDDSDLGEAVGLALAWVEKIKDPAMKWYLAKGKAVEGPLDWAAVEAATADTPRRLLCLANDRSWMPVGLLRAARDG